MIPYAKFHTLLSACVSMIVCLLNLHIISSVYVINSYRMNPKTFKHIFIEPCSWSHAYCAKLRFEQILVLFTNTQTGSKRTDIHYMTDSVLHIL